MRWSRKAVPRILVTLIASLLLAAAGQHGLAQETNPPRPTAESGLPPSTKTVLLKEGTEVDLKLAQKLTSKSAVVGEPVELVLAEDLKVGDAVVVRQGARVLGTVIEGKVSEKQKREAHQLKIRLDYLRAGTAKVKLRGEEAGEGKRNKGAMVAGTIALGVSGLLLTSGKKYVIPEGTPVKAYVYEDIELSVPDLPSH